MYKKITASYCGTTLLRVINNSIVMRLISMMLIICMHVSVFAFGQKINIKKHNASLSTVLKEINKQSGYHILYDASALLESPKIDIDAKNMSVIEVLDRCFEGLALQYLVKDKSIIISKRQSQSSKITEEKLVQLEVAGRVINESGTPLESVTVGIKNSNSITMTDRNGNFKIDVLKAGETLVFSAIGYQTDERTIINNQPITIILRSITSDLDEVVVVGYSTQQRKDITGAVSVVDMNTVNAIPTASVSNALQGQASGVTIIGSGVPGGRSEIFIRGVTSFGNTQPLVLVDGIQGSLDDLNMNDIESLQVLKDAGAASIYGVRGANGVIVVTTKKGKAGDAVVSYDSYFGTTLVKKGNVFNLLNSEDYARLTKEVNPGTILFANGLPDFLYANSAGNGIAKAGDPEVDPALYNFDFNNTKNNYLIQKVNKEGTDWYHEVSKNAPLQSHNLSVGGGNSKSNYMFSLGYLNQQGTIMETYLKRYSVRVNSQHKINNNIRIGENLYSYYRLSPGFNNSAEGNAISLSFRNMPIMPVYDIMGNYGGTWIGPELGTTENPVASQLRTVDNRNHNWNISGNAFAEVDFLGKQFTLRTSFGGHVLNRYNYSLGYIGYNDRQGFDGTNSFSEGSSYSSSYTWTNTLRYSRVINQHDIKVLIGSEAISSYGRNVGGSSRTYFSMNPDYLNLSNGTTNISNYSGAFKSALYSLFGRLDYSFNDKYILGVTVRRDGSSVFGADKRFGVFPSFSVGWRVSGEEFMKDVSFINDLKIRASYGILGSQANISPTNAYTLFNSGFGTSYYLISGVGNGTTQGFYQSGNGNKNTGWEQNIVTNVGLDVVTFNNKINASVEWYKKSINGLLFPQPLPATTGGASAPIINIGDIQNKGWEFSIRYRENINNNLQLNVATSVSAYKNEVVNIPGGYFDIKSSRIGNLVRIQEGQSIGAFYGYKIVGLFKDDADVSSSPVQTSAAPGRFKYKDVDGDNKITSADRMFYGDPNPDFVYSLNLGVSYKKFDFSADFYGSQGNDVLNFTRYYTDFMSVSEGKGRSNVLLNAWTPQNLNTGVPKLEYAPNFSTNSVPNSYYLEDGSFFKNRSMQLGYIFDAELIERFKIKSLKVYLQGTNLFTATKYTGLDPELNGTLSGANASTSFGIDMGNYPNNQKQFLLGMKLSF